VDLTAFVPLEDAVGELSPETERFLVLVQQLLISGGRA
jgi:hypothetical protein